ncbi:hypothetical protein MBLNU230_g6691t1 [Neophaeotheca triangularis]
MEEVHGVDVSWLHQPNREHHRKTAPSSPGLTRDAKPPTSHHSGHSKHAKSSNQKTNGIGNPTPNASKSPEGEKTFPFPAQATTTPPKLSQPETSGSSPSTPTAEKSEKPSNSNNGNGEKITPKSQQKRPNLLNRSSAEKLGGGPGSRRASWISNISSKFSSSQASTPPASSPGPGNNAAKQSPGTTTSPPAATSTGTTSNSENKPGVVDSTGAEEAEPYVPAKPKDGTSFFSSLTRRLSSASSSTAVPKAGSGSGGVCPRRVLNVDRHRERCLVPELDTNRLRRVSFCVDVEIAGGPKYKDEEGPNGGEGETEGERKRKKVEIRKKELAEGKALKNPDKQVEENEGKDGEKEGNQKEKEKEKESGNGNVSEPVPVPSLKKEGSVESSVATGASVEDNKENALPVAPVVGSLDEEKDASKARKREKKKKSEEERKERKEKRRRRAEDMGSIPVELSNDASPPPSPGSTPPRSRPGSGVATPNQAASNGAAPAIANKQDRPTTDPVRIYRRCCQLRETPILKRITEQLMSPTCTSLNEPGIVNCLDLTGSRLQLADVVTLGDWLAVVPVKRLLLEDADLNDEGVRVILAGLLAARRPTPTKRNNVQPRHRSNLQPGQFHLTHNSSDGHERTGMVEKITLKNNPRIGRTGWKHISLFIYMCRSLRALDLSLISFPSTLPPSLHVTPTKAPFQAPTGKGTEIDAAETLYKCLSERLGSSKLEELSLSECGLAPSQIQRLISAATIAGVSRLGLAGNNLETSSLESCIHFLRSGVCHALDLGGNNLRGKLGAIAECFMQKPDVPVWGLSLADCNLLPSDLLPLFPALARLVNFRFIDLSHNRELCDERNPDQNPAQNLASEKRDTPNLIHLLRKYIPRLHQLKRIHLADVGMSPKQAISLAEVLPEGPRMAHLDLRGNEKLEELARAEGEGDGHGKGGSGGAEEACALYAGLMAAVRVSRTIVCLDVGVPGPESPEIVKALAKQVVAYCLRNMEDFAIADATGDSRLATSDSKQEPSSFREVPVPDILTHLVGHMNHTPEHYDEDGTMTPGEHPAPDDDYIVGGTGVVRALQYVLGDKSDPNRRHSGSVPGTPLSGPMTPVRERPDSSAGLSKQSEKERKGKAKEMSKNLLLSARKIRARLQPAIAREAREGDEMSYRRLLFLDQTLRNMVARFEEEYPETRVRGSSLHQKAANAEGDANDAGSVGSDPSEEFKLAEEGTSSTTSGDVDAIRHTTAKDDDIDDEMQEDGLRPGMSRSQSEVSLYSRKLAEEEGRVHRLGSHLRREIIDASESPTAASNNNNNSNTRQTSTTAPNPPNTTSEAINPNPPLAPVTSPQPATPTTNITNTNPTQESRLASIGSKLEALSGEELRRIYEAENSGGWKEVLEKVGANLEDLRRLQEMDPEAWGRFKESQVLARMNARLGEGD